MITINIQVGILVDNVIIDLKYSSFIYNYLVPEKFELAIISLKTLAGCL